MLWQEKVSLFAGIYHRPDNRIPKMASVKKRSKLFSVFIYLFFNMCVAVISGIYSQTFFNGTPEWISEARGQVATGLGVADINMDGWEDIVVANGNDILRQSVEVYFNNGNGTFPVTPGWQSADVDYHGHLAIGDINGDGYPDVAVSVFLGPGKFYEPGLVKVYFNNQGQLETFPGYQTADSMFTFSCALGDADADGDLDLAVAGGQPYHYGVGPYFTSGRIYYNQSGVLDSLPGWLSQNSMGALDVAFADMDCNGYLDLIFGCELTPNSIFLADSMGRISTIPSWQSQDNNHYANSITITHISNDIYPDLIVSDNNQLGGNGQFKGYYFNSAPSGFSMPAWTSAPISYASGIITADLDGNGKADLIGGRWWGRVYIYKDSSYTISMKPDWFSGTSSVIEAFALRDVDQDGLYNLVLRDTVAQDTLKIYYLHDMQFEKFIALTVNNRNLQQGIDYCTVPDGEWISFRQYLVYGDQLEIEYQSSWRKDLVVTNWDGSIGNFLFYNRFVPTSLSEKPQMPRTIDINVYPNPFNSSCRFTLTLDQSKYIQFYIYDLLGRRIRDIVHAKLSAGTHFFEWNGMDQNGQDMGTGMYFYVLESAGEYYSGRLLMIK